VDNFFFKISAYFINGSASVRKAKIHCPFPRVSDFPADVPSICYDILTIVLRSLKEA
jgi:hypothetical protein